MKLNYVSFFTAGVLLSMGALAQSSEENLVRNGSFEDLNKPVKTWDQLSHATGWSNANLGSADVFSKDARLNTVGIPDNLVGNGASAFEGEHFAGFVAYKDDQRKNWKRVLDGREDPFRPAFQKYSEYLQTELSSTLVEGEKYEVTFRVKLASGSDRAVSGIGAYLAPSQLNYNHRHFLDERPQVSTTQIVKDKNDWTVITGKFTADGNERFLVLGAFVNGGFDSEKIVEGADNQRAYYYIDGVELRKAPEPDRDGDGIPDAVDECPDIAGLAQFNGCPDSDGDGIPDHLDACPEVAGPAEFDGCPDTDGDGIPDHLDACPTVAGVAENNGCPKIAEKTLKLFERALTGIQFQTGSSVILKSSYSILDEVVDVMKDNPSYNLEIHGHTDSTGKKENNQKLSEDRAASVLNYLTSKGIDANRMKSFGHGQDDPVADNGTAAGRSKNRRVAFKVTFMR